jgi:polysaccharide biosynthesis protein PslA
MTIHVDRLGVLQRPIAARPTSRLNATGVLHPSNDFARSPEAGRQSGLLYLLRDGTPFLPPPSAARAIQLGGKRLIDLALSAALLVALLPLLMGIALAIKVTTRGPVLFRQRRVGWNGRHFEILKFRTMFAEKGDAAGVIQAQLADDRVTPFGRFLRTKNFDELPQLINVLLGHMSLVGPRPHVSGMLAGGIPYEDLVPYYELRLAMRPGLTGWAQANGLRGATRDPDRARARIDHDIAYIQNFSLALDIKTMALTLVREFPSGTGI